MPDRGIFEKTAGGYRCSYAQDPENGPQICATGSRARRFHQASRAANPTTSALPAAGQATSGASRLPTTCNYGKTLVSLRIDTDLLAAFKANGKGWQTRINATLRTAVGK